MSGAAIEFIQVSHTMLGHPVPSDLNLEVQRHGLVAALDLFILADDLKYFPPYYAAPVVRSETLTRYPELLPAFLALKQVISGRTNADHALSSRWGE